MLKDRVKTPALNFRTEITPIKLPEHNKGKYLSERISEIHEKLRKKKTEYKQHMKTSEIRRKKIIDQVIKDRVSFCVRKLHFIRDRAKIFTLDF